MFITSSGTLNDKNASSLDTFQCSDVLFDNRLKQHKYSSKVDDPNEAGSSDAEDASGDEASSKNSPK